MSHSIDDLEREQCEVLEVLRTNPDGSGILNLRCEKTGEVRTTWLRKLTDLDVGCRVLAVLIELPAQRSSPLRTRLVDRPQYVALRVISEVTHLS